MSVILLYDLTVAQPKLEGTTRAGGVKYCEMVFLELIRRGIHFSCYYNAESLISKEILDICSRKGIVLYDICKQNLRDIVEESNANVLFSALPKMHLANLEGVRIIGTTHGLRRLELPADKGMFEYADLRKEDIAGFFLKKFFSKFLYNKIRKKLLKLWIKDNYNIVTVSNHTATAIKIFFPEMADKQIPVFYSPCTCTRETNIYKYKCKYFLMVSGNRWSKNNLRAIKALDYLFSNGQLKEYRVKVTGAKDATKFKYSIKNIDRFDFVGYVDEDELDQLYHDAYCLVYPSINEGFGYPPLEAMHYSVPVITSSFTSISEVCGDAALYCNPYDVMEIANRINQITDTELRAKYSVKSELQYQIITAKQTEDLNRLVDYILQEM